MIEKETLHFKIGLSGSTNKKFPEFQIIVDDTVITQGNVKTLAGDAEYIEFDSELTEGTHELKVKFLNKTAGDTTIFDGKIVEDLLLNIESICIDGVDLDSLIWTASIYRPDYPDEYLDEQQKSITEIKNCVNLGWNGEWSMKFSSPFYIWLLDNL